MPRSGHDRATIASRSGHDRGPGHASHAVQSSGNDSTLKEQRSRLDRAAIAVRSGRDRGVLPQVFSAVRLESDAPDLLRKEKKIGCLVAVRSRSCSLNIDEDGLSSCRHMAIGEPSDRRHLNRPFAHVMHLMIAWTWVHAISAVPPESNAHRAAMRLA